MILNLALAAFLLAHGAIHLGYLGRPPATAGGPAWPFTFEGSWILSRWRVAPSAAHAMGLALVGVTMASFSIAAIASLGVVPAEIWTIFVVTGALASAATIFTWFHPWLVVGIAIDVFLLWASLAQGWTPDRLA